MDLTQITFYAIAILASVSALGVVASKDIVRAASFLIVALSMIAALFALLGSLFLSMVQLMIYGGAVIVVILFGVMLTRREEPKSRIRQLTRSENLAYLGFSVLLVLTLAFLEYRIGGLYLRPEGIPADSQAIGIVMYSQYRGVVIALAGLVATAGVGSIYLVKRKRGDSS